MLSINSNSREIMDLLTEGLTTDNRSRKIDAGRGYMAVHVELIGTTAEGPMYSVAHYYEQNGDLMRDPDMEFLKKSTGDYYPLSFRQDGLGIYQEAVTWDENGRITGYYPRRCRDLVSFANMWLNNIKVQQGLPGKAEPCLKR